MNEAEADHVLRRGQVGWDYERMQNALAAALPEDHPTRKILQRVIAKRQSGESLTDADLSDLRSIGVGEDTLTQLREIGEERARLDEQERRLREELQRRQGGEN